MTTPAFSFLPASASDELPLAIARPSSGSALPLILCLHGAGERGSDGRIHCGHFAPVLNSVPAVIVAPQVPLGQLWATCGWGTRQMRMAAQPSAQLAFAQRTVLRLLDDPQVDRRRFYIIGLSMGGWGTWEFCCRWPSLPAAALALCGGGDVEQAPRLRDIPIHAVHGALDTVITAEQSTRMVEAVKRAGGSAQLTIYPDVAHDCWTRALGDAQMLAWLCAQRQSGM